MELVRRRNMTDIQKPSKFKGITWRWAMGSLFYIIVLLFVAIFAISYSMRENYYSAAVQALEYRVMLTTNAIPTRMQASNSDRYQYIFDLVENFSEKEKFEFCILGFNGRTIASSSGFLSSTDEYLDIISVENKLSVYEGYNVKQEHIIALTVPLTEPANEIYYVRIISSLENIDQELLENIQLLILAGVLILAFSIFSGAYFIRSIVMPIRKISMSTSTIANGDFDVRLQKKHNDEIGILCDNINDMAVKLSEADRVKNEFISSVSHELRTPLTSIKGWAETVLSVGRQDKEVYTKGMKIISRETDRLYLMVEDLLDFSRLKSGNLTFEKDYIDIIAELSDAVLTVTQQACRLNVDISYEEPPEPAIVFADINRMKQVFVNILDNSIKYSAIDGKIKVDTNISEKSIVISITDNGKGIHPDEIEKVTEKFYKGSNSVKGSGIGLAVVSEIIEAHDGNFTIESEIGEGTVVKVELPINEKV